MSPFSLLCAHKLFLTLHKSLLAPLTIEASKEPTGRETIKTRHRRVRKKLSGITERPRLAVFRSNQHVYVQVIDTQGNTLWQQHPLYPRTFVRPLKTPQARLLIIIKCLELIMMRLRTLFVPAIYALLWLLPDLCGRQERDPDFRSGSLFTNTH